MKSVGLELPSARDADLAQRLYDAETALNERVYAVEKRLALAAPAKPIVLPLLQRQGKATGAKLERQRTLLKAIDETYFKIPLAPGYVYYEGVVTEPKNGDAAVSRFPAAAAGDNRHMSRQVDAREQWVRTRPRISFWYTSPVGNVALFSFRFVLRVFGTGGGMTSSVFVTDFTGAGPAAANGGPLFLSVVGGAIFPPAPFGIAQVRLGRLGGDANPNDLDILLAVCTFEEVA